LKGALVDARGGGVGVGVLERMPIEHLILGELHILEMITQGEDHLIERGADLRLKVALAPRYHVGQLREHADKASWSRPVLKGRGVTLNRSRSTRVSAPCPRSIE
jgi:hypothetical protein